MEYELALWEAFQRPPAADDPQTDAFLEAMARGDVDPNDAEAVARWRAQHSEGEPVTREEVRRGGA